jgi:hypothetical protein
LFHTKAFADALWSIFPPNILDQEWVDPFVVAGPRCVDPDRWLTQKRRKSQKDEKTKRRKTWRYV